MRIMIRSRKQVEAEFDRLYAAGQEVLARLNPCQLVKQESGHYTCAAGVPSCCTWCKHLGPDGCMVECLGCKLGACQQWVFPTYGNWPAAKEEMVKLQQEASNAGISLFPGQSKESTLSRGNPS